ncbi:MAG: hypothetical protein HYY85_04850 [Deltaproteobacteria bacterium]|nr:hypothetical protein [Deltaproteobacteria bacterium]
MNFDQVLQDRDDRFCGHCGHLVDFQRHKGFCIFCQQPFPESDWERPSQINYGMGGGAEVTAPAQEAVTPKARRAKRRKAA